MKASVLVLLACVIAAVAAAGPEGVGADVGVSQSVGMGMGMGAKPELSSGSTVAAKFEAEATPKLEATPALEAGPKITTYGREEQLAITNPNPNPNLNLNIETQAKPEFFKEFKEAKVVGGEEKPFFKEEKGLGLGWAEQLEQARLTGAPLAPVLSLSSQRIEQHPMLSFETARLVAAKTPPAPQPIVKPKNAPVMASKLENAQWTMVQQPITQKRQQLPVIELAPILQPYTVHSTTFQTENIKQPITEPVFQPYMQRFVQQAQPVVQPIVQRIVQPIVHREVHSYLQTKNERAPDADTIVKPTEFQLQTNQAIRGGDLAALPISKGKSHST